MAEETGFVFKIAVYAGGVAAGLASKLATMQRKKPITVVDIAVNSALAFGAAYFTWAVLAAAHHQEMATVCSVICGRYADDMLKLAYKVVKKTISNVSAEVDEADEESTK